MKKELVECIEIFLKDRIRKYRIEVRRGDTRSLATHFIDYFLPFTLPCILDIKENLKQKMLYCLWNLTLDDCIDAGRDAKPLLGDTTRILSCMSLEKKVNSQTPAGQIINELMERMLSVETCNSNLGKTFFFLDALDQIKGFAYEQIIYERKELATLSEYEEHTAVTNSPRVYLDIDICTTREKTLLPQTIRILREAFRFFGLALTLKGDIATFEREFFEENVLNSVILLGIENSVLPSNILDLKHSEKNEIFRSEIHPLFDIIRKRSLQYRDQALEKLGQVKEIDISSLEQAIIYYIDKEFPGAEMKRIPTNVN